MAQADYPMATWIGADVSNFHMGRKATVNKVVIHITDGRGQAYPVAQMWQGSGHGTSAHFVIGQDATVIQSVRLSDTAWHAHDANASSVGIEHCARSPKQRDFGPDDPGLPPTPAQYHASAELVAWLLQKYNLPCDRQHVLGHKEADSKTDHDDCPTGNWDWAVYWPMVQAAYGYGAGVCHG